jgi:hypothetical protein
MAQARNISSRQPEYHWLDLRVRHAGGVPTMIERLFAATKWSGVAG